MTPTAPTPDQVSPTALPPPEEVTADIDELAAYAAEIASGRIWRIPRDSAASTDGLIASWGEEGLDIIDLSQLTALRIFHEEVGAVSWSPDGSRLAFNTPSGERLPTIWVIDRDGSHPRTLLEGNLASGPVWSPVGNQIAVIRWDPGVDPWEGGPADVLLVDADTGALNLLAADLLWEMFNLSPEPLNPGLLRWAPDGSRLLLPGVPDRIVEGPRTPTTYLLNADGSGARKLFDTSMFDDVWSPNGGLIAYTRDVRDDDGRITAAFVDLVDPDTGDVRTLSQGALPSWSPDSRRIAYQADFCIDFNIVVTGLDGANQVRLTDLDDPLSSPQWSPNSGEIAFIEWAEQNRVRTVDSGTGEFREVAKVTARGIGFMNLTWSPDGAYLLFDTSDGFGICEGVRN